MQNKFTSSINIERDFDKELKYIPTVNAKDIVNQLINSFQTGIHSFNIIGSYGTGKSSFILALEKNLKKQNEYFIPLKNQFNGLKEFIFINIVGEYSSLENTIRKIFNSDNEAIEILQQLYKKASEQNKFLFIVIDEFGKFLEYASKNNPEKELYFIQQFAEFINDIDKNAILITTLHQDFATYSNSLDFSQKNEWNKVKGRFKELAFNEPIEQLLFIAAEFIEGKKQINNLDTFNKLFNLIKTTKIISLSKSVDLHIAQRLYPLDLLSASVLTLALQKYGQNERSLFSFLQANNINSMFKMENNIVFYNIEHVFNYLLHNFYNQLNTPLLNPDAQQWASIRESIERIESFWTENIEEAIKIVKTIGLLNIFSSYKSNISRKFLEQYSKLSLCIENSKTIINKLEERKIIRYAKYRSQYILLSGTDMDINKEIENAGAFVEKNTDNIQKLQFLINLPYIPAKAVQYETGTPRFFEFIVSETPINQIPKNEIDGFVNLIFNTNLSYSDILESSRTQQEAILYAFFKNSKNINSIVFEIDKINYVLERTDSYDKVALKELNRQKTHEISRLNFSINDNLFGNPDIIWFFKGQEIKMQNQTDFNKYLSKICREIYYKTAIYRNESVNKHRISGTISSARKLFISSLLQNWQKENLSIDKFPPHKAIYLTLLKNTKIHKIKNNLYYFDTPAKDSGFLNVWNECENYLNNAKNRKKSLIELVEILSDRPFKLKQGLIDFWLPLFLFIKRDEFALFCEGNYVPVLNTDIMDLINRSIKDFAIKTFSIDGVKLELFNEYRRLINLDKEKSTTQTNLIQTIKPFLVFYKQLPEYTKQTKALSRNALRLRDSIAKAKEPVETFFEDFPQALGFNNLDLKKNEELLPDFIKYFKEAIRELRTCYVDYIGTIENLIIQEIGLNDKTFVEYKKVIINRYKQIKSNLLRDKKKVFLNRLRSPIEDKTAWIDSLVQVIMSKKLEKIKDTEKNILSERLIDTFRELDNLIPVHKAKIKNPKHHIIKFDITTEKGTKTNQLIISENKKKKIEFLETKLLSLLKEENDSLIQKAAIIQILQKKIK